MKKIFFCFSLSSVLLFSSAFAEACCLVKEYACTHPYYSAGFKIRYKKNKRPRLIESWKYSKGNVSGKPDYLFKGNLAPFSLSSSELTQFSITGDWSPARYLHIFANEELLKNTSSFQSTDFEDPYSYPDLNANCQLKKTRLCI